MNVFFCFRCVSQNVLEFSVAQYARCFCSTLLAPLFPQQIFSGKKTFTDDVEENVTKKFYWQRVLVVYYISSHRRMNFIRVYHHKRSVLRPLNVF